MLRPMPEMLQAFFQNGHNFLFAFMIFAVGAAFVITGRDDNPFD